MPADRRLLVVAESLGVGGTESHLIRISLPLATLGWDTTIYCLSEPGLRAGQVEAGGIRVCSSPPPRNQGETSPHAQRNVALGANRLFWLMRQWRPAIVHFYLPGPYLVGAPLAVAAGVPIKIMSRRSLSHYQKRRPLLARMERMLHGRMDVVIGNSRAVTTELAEEGVAASKIRLIYNGIDVEPTVTSRAEARRELGIAADTLVGIMVANLKPYKGHQDLLEGLAGIARDLPAAWRMLCAGRDEGLKPQLEELAEVRGIAANVQFLGERLDVPRLLGAADFGVLSSWEEGFSNVILEAMAAGLPMVVTDVGGNAEIVSNEVSGLVVASHNPQALGSAILRLARERELRDRLGQAGQARIRQEFSIGRCVEAHRALYEELLARR